MARCSSSVDAGATRAVAMARGSRGPVVGAGHAGAPGAPSGVPNTIDLRITRGRPGPSSSCPAGIPTPRPGEHDDLVMAHQFDSLICRIGAEFRELLTQVRDDSRIVAALREDRAVKSEYLESIALIERLHRQFLEVVKNELERVGVQDINNVQTLILYNIGEDEMTVGELTARGYYLGSNSYNVRKMVENGYLVQERSAHDRRSVRVRLPEKGLALCARIDEMFVRHVEDLDTSFALVEELEVANKALRRLERFWISALNFGLRLRTLAPMTEAGEVPAGRFADRRRARRLPTATPALRDG